MLGEEYLFMQSNNVIKPVTIRHSYLPEVIRTVGGIQDSKPEAPGGSHFKGPEDRE